MEPLLRFARQRRSWSGFLWFPIWTAKVMIYPSFQQPILGRIVKLRSRLIELSAEFRSYDWLQDLRALVSECVSLIDITLHQLYFKAQYDPLPGWSFDQEKLGARHGRRLTDKIGWVYKITGSHINLHADDQTEFSEIRELRNHLSHFDPPCFCFTIEDAARWLNQVKAVARLNWQIRNALGSPLCGPLIELLLTEEAVLFRASREHDCHSRAISDTEVSNGQPRHSTQSSPTGIARDKERTVTGASPDDFTAGHHEARL